MGIESNDHAQLQVGDRSLSRRRLIGTSAAVGLGIAAGGALTGATPALAQDEKVFVYAALKEPGSIDPGTAVDGQAYRIMRNVYDSLIHHQPGSYDLVPALAETWDVSEDGLVYTFHLRQGVTFHDGTPFDAEAVKVSYDRVLSLGQGPASYLTNLESVAVLAPETVTMTLTKPSRFFPQYVAQISIVSPTAIGENAADGDQASAWLSRNGVGTGPYKLERWDLAQQFVLVRNPDYWAGWGESAFDRVIFRTVPEAATMRQLLEVGEVHMVDTVSPADIAALSENPDLKLVYSTPITVNHLTMNTTKGATQDPVVRQALYAAFPYEKVKDLVYGGFAELATGPLGAGLPGYIEGAPIGQDLEKAKQLLADAGFADGGLKLTFAFPEDQTTQEVGVVFQEELRSLNVELELQMIPWTQLVELMHDPAQSAEMSFLVMTPVTGDPVFVLGQNFLGRNAGGPWNWAYYNNPEVDALLDQAATEASDEDMLTALRQAIDVIMADYPTIYATSPTRAFAMRSNVDGYVYIPSDYIYAINLHSMSFSS